MDPYKDLTPDQRVDILGSLGLKWVGGEGQNAIWQAPSGERMTERSALLTALGDKENAPGGFKPATPAATSGSRLAPDRTAQIGIDSQGNRRYFTIDSNGFTMWGADAPPANDASSGVGWANLAENRRQFDITQEQRLQQQKQEYELAQKRYEQTQQQINDARAVNAANMLFAQNKEAFAQSSQNKQLALQARGQLMQERQAALDLQVRQSTLDQQWSQFNATMQQRVAEANQQAAEKKQERLATIATQAGTLAQDAGDRGKLAATMLANSGWGGANKALSGQNYITDESLTPLESLLRTREDVQAQGAPFTFTPTERPERLTMPVLPDLTAMMNAVQTTPTVGGAGGGGGGMPAGLATASPDSGAQMMAASRASDAAAAANAGGVPAAAHGGLMGGAYISGERGPEINIPLPDGQALVLNQKQAARMGLDLRRMMENGQPNYQDGGIFGGAFENVGDSSRSLSREFVTQAGQRALTGTPFAGGGQLPSPVYLSSPAIDPITSQLIGSLKAIQEGVPAQATAYYAQMYRPTGMRESVVGRSR